MTLGGSPAPPTLSRYQAGSLFYSEPIFQTLSESADPVQRLAEEVRDTGWLVYSAKPNQDDWDLFRMRPDGSDRRKLTDTREFNEAGARFVPDGRRLLYYRLPASEPVDDSRTTMAIVRLRDTPMIGDDSAALRQRLPAARGGPRLDLGTGWEPHWTSARSAQSGKALSK